MEMKGYVYTLFTSLFSSKASFKRDPWDSTLFMLVRSPIESERNSENGRERGIVRMAEREGERVTKAERESDNQMGSE